MTGRHESKPVVQSESATIKDIIDVPAMPDSKDAGGFLINQEALSEAWNSFANTLIIEDSRLYSTLTTHMPILENETKIIFQISNPLQKEPLLKIQPRLLQHLKTTLNNDNVNIEITLAEKNGTTKAYTAEDKFAQMSRKNPALLTFKQQFGLDFE